MKTWNFLPPLGPTVSLLTVLLLIGLSDRANLRPERPSTPERSPGVQQVEAIALGGAVASDHESDIELFANRPLLAEGRRLPEARQDPAISDPEEPTVPEPVIESPEEPPAETPPPPEPPAVHMLGSMILGNSYRALIHVDSDGSELWVEKGADIGGWTLVEIAQSSIRLRSGGHEIAIQLFE